MMNDESADDGEVMEEYKTLPNSVFFVCLHFGRTGAVNETVHETICCCGHCRGRQLLGDWRPQQKASNTVVQYSDAVHWPSYLCCPLTFFSIP